MPRFFTHEQAERLLPQVEGLLRDALFHKAEMQRGQDEFDAATNHIRMSGGARVDHGKLLAMRAKRDASVVALKATIEKIAEIGVEVKDLDIGLVDFLTHYEGREVYLCWKLGEKGISFWHAIEDGFRGRKPIDEEFLTKHRGETSQ